MIRPIEIRAVLNGFKCVVGCQEVVFETIEGMMTHLYSYLQNPEKVEREFLSSPAAFNAKHTYSELTPANGCAPSYGAEQGRQVNPVPTYRGDGIGVGNSSTGRY